MPPITMVSQWWMDLFIYGTVKFGQTKKMVLLK